MKLVKFITVLFLLVPSLSTAQEYIYYEREKYKRGEYVCTDESEIGFKNNPQDLDEQYFHFSCEVVKGNDNIGLPELYRLADDRNHLLASDFLAHYLQTDGELDDSWEGIAVNEAIKYHMKTQDIIRLIPNYPPDLYKSIEYNEQIELDSVYKLAHLYLLRYQLGVIGDYHVTLLNSPNYEGGDLDTYPMYNTLMHDSLDNVVRYAGECANLSKKPHFRENLYNVTIKTCSLMRELALDIIPLEEKRKKLLSQLEAEGKSLSRQCEEYTNEEDCPEYYETQKKISQLAWDYIDEERELWGKIPLEAPESYID